MGHRQPSKPLNGDVGRQTMISDVEAAIASRWHRKDPALQIGGLSKSPAGFVGGFKIFQVDGEWLRDNLDTTFGTGGHGLVHTFIPLDEIWVDPITESISSLVFHEAVEFRLMMQQNQSYWAAHQEALQLQVGRQLTMGNVERQLQEVLPRRFEDIARGYLTGAIHG